jgi:hypothetical protein
VIENTAGSRLSEYVLASKGYARPTVRTIFGGQTGSATQLTVVPAREECPRIRSTTAGITTTRTSSPGRRIIPTNRQAKSCHRNPLTRIVRPRRGQRPCAHTAHPDAQSEGALNQQL